MSAIILCLLLFQNAGDTVKRENQLREVATVLSNPQTEYAPASDQAFIEKFNALIDRLMDFSDSYKTRNAIDVKKAAAVRKAWRELEKSEALFREDSKK
jgi:hypothetical protein